MMIVLVDDASVGLVVQEGEMIRMFNVNNFGWCQWIMLFLLTLMIVTGVIEHGRPREAYNGYRIFISALLEFALLYNGGFFK